MFANIYWVFTRPYMAEQNIPETRMSSWKALPSICEIPHYPQVLHAHLLPIIIKKTHKEAMEF